MTPPRTFVDSNILLDGLLSNWSTSRAILILSVRRVFKMVLAEDVRLEVERCLLKLLGEDPERGSQLIDDYDKFIKLTRPEQIPLTTSEEVVSHRHLIRHIADVPVLVAALKSQPGWLVTKNTHHFTKAVAHRTGLRIVHPDQFVKILRIEQ
ncbi:MAG: PIN domain-containing protein [Acidobacteria bacterium]|nr:PIN domain-containing protein [Acidobacteriota bacterium]